jgi:NADH-quinone oxidoreductase subunit N
MKKNIFLEKISLLGYCFKQNWFLSFLLIFFFFSLAGLPPFPSFIAKFFFLNYLFFNDFFLFFFLMIFFTLVSFYYYIRVAKYIVYNFMKNWFFLDFFNFFKNYLFLIYLSLLNFLMILSPDLIYSILLYMSFMFI